MKKTVLITGASRGIGRSTAKLFAEKGYNVVINYLNSEAEALSLYKNLVSCGCHAMLSKADVSKKQEVIKMVQDTITHFYKIDVLVNNAGISEQLTFDEITEEKWDNMININLKSAYNCTSAVLPHMINEKSGKIINVSSIWGITGASMEVHYSTAKAGLIGFTKALAKEVGPSGITVNCVAPGVIETDMTQSLSPDDKLVLLEETPLIKFGAPLDIAKAIYFFASEDADFITGQVLSPNGGFVI